MRGRAKWNCRVTPALWDKAQRRRHLPSLLSESTYIMLQSHRVSRDENSWDWKGSFILTAWRDSYQKVILKNKMKKEKKKDKKRKPKTIVCQAERGKQKPMSVQLQRRSRERSRDRSNSLQQWRYWNMLQVTASLGYIMKGTISFIFKLWQRFVALPLSYQSKL